MVMSDEDFDFDSPTGSAPGSPGEGYTYVDRRDTSRTRDNPREEQLEARETLKAKMDNAAKVGRPSHDSEHFFPRNHIRFMNWAQADEFLDDFMSDLDYQKNGRSILDAVGNKAAWKSYEMGEWRRGLPRGGEGTMFHKLRVYEDLLGIYSDLLSPEKKDQVVEDIFLTNNPMESRYDRHTDRLRKYIWEFEGNIAQEMAAVELRPGGNLRRIIENSTDYDPDKIRHRRLLRELPTVDFGLRYIEKHPEIEPRTDGQLTYDPAPPPGMKRPKNPNPKPPPKRRRFR